MPRSNTDEESNSSTQSEVPTTQSILCWEESSREICDLIRQERSVLKIILKTKNEPFFLESWIEHHARIVGIGNLIVADNGSNFEVEAILKRYPGIVSFKFSGLHYHIHDRHEFRSFYEAVDSSCDFYTCVDTDERLFWIGDDHWIADERFIDFVSGFSRTKLLPGVLVDNVTNKENEFYIPIDKTEQDNILLWGKPIIPTMIDIPRGHRLHNCQFPPDLITSEGRINLASIHLTRLAPRLRLESNKAKLLLRGVIKEDASYEDIAELQDADIPNDGASFRFRDEIRAILSFLSGDDAENWGYTPEGRVVRMVSDGRILFDSPDVASDYSSIRRDGVERLRLAMESELNQGNPAVYRSEVVLPSGASDEEIIRFLLESAARYPLRPDQFGDPIFLKALIRRLIAVGQWQRAEEVLVPTQIPGRIGWHHLFFARELDAASLGDKATKHWLIYAEIDPQHPDVVRALEERRKRGMLDRDADVDRRD